MSNELTASIEEIFDSATAVLARSRESLTPRIVAAARLMAERLREGNKILACGNGGSAADAQHFIAELLNRFEIERTPLAALSLTTDTSTLTSIANDYSFSDVFSKQVRALGHANDVLVAITTSGRSDNVIAAIETARERGLLVVLLSGKSGEPAASLLAENDIEIRVPDESTARIQEVHGLIIHCICGLIDRILFQGETDENC